MRQIKLIVGEEVITLTVIAIVGFAVILLL